MANKGSIAALKADFNAGGANAVVQNTSQDITGTRMNNVLNNVADTIDAVKADKTALETEAARAAAAESGIAGNLSSHEDDTSNPHAVDKSQVGLANVDNTSDLLKPLSNAAVAALLAKADKVTNAVNGHLAALDASGNLVDCGFKASEFLKAVVYQYTRFDRYQGIKAAYDEGKKIYIYKDGDFYALTSFSYTAGQGIDYSMVIDFSLIDAKSLTAKSLTYYEGKETQGEETSEWHNTITNANKSVYVKPAGGIPSTDMTTAVQTSLGKADSALQSHQSLAAYRTAAEQDVIDAGKQATINDLSSIRSGAALGATAQQPVPIETPAAASAYELDADTLVNLGTLAGAITLTLAAAPSDGKLHIYAFTFTADSTAPTIAWPSGISWAGGNAPTITGGKSYEVSISQLKTLISEF